MGKAEAKIEKYLKDEVKKAGGFSRKYVSPGHRGVPDQIVFLNGIVMFVEVKSPVGKLSGLQERELMRLENAGAYIAVVSTVKEVNECLNLIT